jgi:glycosyltransferase involved in cell wall biosynthesis
MGYFMRIVSLDGIPENCNFEDYSKIKEQVLPLTMSRYRVPQAFLTMIILFIIAPLRSLKTLGAMLKMLFHGPQRKQILKNYFQAALLVNLHLIDKEISHLHAHCDPGAARTAYFATLLTGLNSSFVALPGEAFKEDFQSLSIPLKNCECIFALSEYEKNYIVEKIFTDKDLLPEMLCFFNGIDLEKFGFKGSSKPPEEPYQFITTAFLTRTKGLDTVLKALEILRKQGVNFRYTVIGDGPELNLLKEKTKTLGLEEWVSFTGVKPRYKIPKLLANADLFVSAQRILENGEQDSIPLSVKEAMAVGLPVVTTNCGALRELVEDEETGLLVPPDNPSEFAAACMRLLTDRDLRGQIIMKARLRIEGVYNIHKQAMAFNEYVINHNLPL